MNSVSKQAKLHPFHYIRKFLNAHSSVRNAQNRSYYNTPVDCLDNFTTRPLLRTEIRKTLSANNLGLRFIMNNDTSKEPLDIRLVSAEEIEKIIVEAISKNNDKQIINIMQECVKHRRVTSKYITMKILRTFSLFGKTEVIAVIQEYSKLLQNNMYLSAGEYQHYMAKALCVKGKVDKGLSLLRECYSKYVELRNLYRIILRGIIQDIILNGSEASIVILKKHVLDYSSNWDDQAPLICMWHICWTSTWFSDHMTADELLDISNVLRSSVREKAVAFSMSALKNEYNEDAVVRLLQALLKYKMMHEYGQVLQVLFSYKLKNRDLRGCSEIVRNCEVLGVSLPTDQQGRYVKMIIHNPAPIATTKHFKLKF